MSALFQYENQVLTLSGDLTSSTVQYFYDALENLLIDVKKDISVDLSAVKRVDTTSLALCLSLERMLANKAKITYQNIPDEMLAIAESVGVGSLFQ